MSGFCFFLSLHFAICQMDCRNCLPALYSFLYSNHGEIYTYEFYDKVLRIVGVNTGIVHVSVFMYV